ncbi:hypothetical protein EB796_006462 [Bugula neritina]|uniref:Uncharacterized protein n=1 Tax=Bugula neritina TaxID=10212 RepID=A0A7J7KCG8_BUGNE|nr:hypothetical protein EB796_006462 [Bugula neritina]
MRAGSREVAGSWEVEEGLMMGTEDLEAETGASGDLMMTGVMAAEADPMEDPLVMGHPQAHPCRCEVAEVPGEEVAWVVACREVDVGLPEGLPAVGFKRPLPGGALMVVTRSEAADGRAGSGWSHPIAQKPLGGGEFYQDSF